MIRFIFSTLLLLALTSAVQGATRSDCLAAKGNRIISACSSAVDAGVKDVKVYAALASTLNANGDSSRAARYLKEGLRNFPGNAELKSLANIINANLSESELIQANSGVRKKSVSTASLKISRIRCLSKSGSAAIKACQDYLSVNASDAEISARLANLTGGSSEPAQQIATAAPAPTQAAPVQTKRQEPPAAPIPAGPDRALVKDIQRELKTLGYFNSSIDGLPGGGTQRAIDQYYRTVRGTSAPRISNSMFSDMVDSTTVLKLAQSHARKAGSLRREGNLDAALSQIEAAKTTAPWSVEFASLERSITADLAQQKRAAEAARLEAEQLARTKALREEKQTKLQLAIAETREQIKALVRLQNTSQSELNTVLSVIQRSKLTQF